MGKSPEFFLNNLLDSREQVIYSNHKILSFNSGLQIKPGGI